MGGYHSGLTAFINMITVIVLVTGGILITKAQVSVTDLVTFLLYISIMTDPVRTMIDFAEMFQNGYSGYERFQEILAIEPDIQDSQGSEVLENVRGTIDYISPQIYWKTDHSTNPFGPLTGDLHRQL